MSLEKFLKQLKSLWLNIQAVAIKIKLAKNRLKHKINFEDDDKK